MIVAYTRPRGVPRSTSARAFEEARGAGRADAARDALLTLDDRVVLVVVERRADLRHVQTDFTGPALEVLTRQLALIREEELVQTPELLVATLLEGLHREVVRGAGVAVEGERVVHPHDADVARVLLEQTIDRRLDAAAERALVVADLDDRDERVVRTALRRRLLDLDLVDRVRIRLLLRLLRLRGRLVRLRRGRGAAVADELRVDVPRRRARLDQAARVRELAVDDLLEGSPRAADPP
jgi:hypothetical protein